MSASQFLQFLFETSQVDAETESLLREAAASEKMEVRKTPLLKALKNLGIPTENITVDEEGAKLTVTDSSLWHEIVRKLGSVEAVNSLADEGWLPEIAGDIGDTIELPEYVLNFLPLHDVEYSEQDKATPVDALNKEFEKGSDVVIPPEQAKLEKERRYGVKVGESEDVANKHQKKIAISTLKMHDLGAKLMGGMTKAEARAFLKKIGYTDQQIAKLEESNPLSEVDALLEASDPGWPNNPSGQPQGTDAAWTPGHSFDHLPDVSPRREKLTAFANEQVVFALPSGEALVTVDRQTGDGDPRMLVAVTADGFRTDYPIQYDNGNLGWDNPEWFSDEFKDKVKQHLSKPAAPVREAKKPVRAAKPLAEVDGRSDETCPPETADKIARAFAGPGFEKRRAKRGQWHADANALEAKLKARLAKDQAAAKAAGKTESIDSLLEAPGGWGDDPAESEAEFAERAAEASRDGVNRLLPDDEQIGGEDAEFEREISSGENPLDDQGQPIMIGFKGDGEGVMSWEDFLEANMDGLDVFERTEIRDTILRGETYKGGGGAAGSFEVWRVQPGSNTALDVQAGNDAAGLNGP